METQKKLIKEYKNRLRIVDSILEEHNCNKLSTHEKGKLSQILYLVNSLLNKRIIRSNFSERGLVKRYALNLVTVLSASFLTNGLDNIKEMLVESLKEVEKYLK